MLFGFDHQLVLFLELGRAHFFQVFDQAFEALLDLAEVVDHQVELDVAGVARGIDGAHVRHGRIVEGAQHVHQRVHVAQRGGVGGVLQASCPMAATSAYSMEAWMVLRGL